MTEKYIIKLPFPGYAQAVVRDGKCMISGMTIEEYIKDNPDLELKVVDLEELENMQREFYVTKFKEITFEDYDEALCVLPPLNWHYIGRRFVTFFNPEPYSIGYHDCYLEDKVNRKYYSARIHVKTTDSKIIEKFKSEIPQ